MKHSCQASMNDVSDLRNSPGSIKYPEWRIFFKLSSVILNDAIQLYHDNEISNDIDICFQTDDQCVVLFTSETSTYRMDIGGVYLCVILSLYSTVQCSRIVMILITVYTVKPLI